MKAIGYQALIESYKLETFKPARISLLRERGSERVSREHDDRQEEIYPPRYDPGEGWQAHLGFALKHEGLNLEVLAALFQRLPREEFIAWIQSAPHSRYIRIAWFLLEWFGSDELPVPDLTQGNYVPVLDDSEYYAIHRSPAETRIRRQRIVNNLFGPPAYCPVIRRTPALKRFEEARLDERVVSEMHRFPEELLHRAAQFLYVKETKSSYAIERLTADQRRTARFVALLERSGNLDCYDKGELIRLQNAIVEERYAATGFRDFQNYVGQSLGPAREWVHYVPPKPDDLPVLMNGWMACCRRIEEAHVHPVITASVAGFGFVFLHPFEDGNGRLHRFLLQHALAAGRFSPPGAVFPVSATMLKQMNRYDAALEAYSKEIARLVEYKLDEYGSMTVLNPSAHHYRFPDLTVQAEALFGFIKDTIQTELVAELEYLSVFDAAKSRMRKVVDMPDRRLDLFIRLSLQNKGSLSEKKRRQFRELNDTEFKRLEGIVKRAISEFPSSSS